MAEFEIKLKGFQQELDKLELLRTVQIPFILQQALNRGLAPKLRENERKVIAQTFNIANSFTITSPMTTKWANFGDLSINFKHRDQADNGNEPAKYLRPQVEGGPVYLTRFNRRLQYNGVLEGSEYAWYWKDRPRNPKGGLLKKIADDIIFQRQNPEYEGWQGLKSGREFLVLGRPSRRTAQARKNNLSVSTRGFRGLGVYRNIGGGKLEQVFPILKRPVTVPAKYDWGEQRLSAFADTVFVEAVIAQINKIFG